MASASNRSDVDPWAADATRFRRSSAALTLLMASLVGAGLAHAAPRDAGSAEGLVLLRQQFSGVGPSDRPERCSIDAEWAGATIPADTARRFLGIRTGKSIATPRPRGARDQLVQIVGDPAGVCTEAEVDALFAARFQDGPAETSVQIGRTHIGFPVFSRSLTRAAMVSSHWLRTRTRAAGHIQEMPVSGHEVLRLFRREHGLWVQVGEEEIGTT